MNYQKIFSQIFVSIFFLAIFLPAINFNTAYAYEYSKEETVQAGSIVPCIDKCTFDDIFRLINNIIEFCLKVLLIPLFVCMLIYAGFKYITAMGDTSKTVKLKSMFGHMIGGLVLILCSWLIVKGILYALGYTEGLMFFE